MMKTWSARRLARFEPQSRSIRTTANNHPNSITTDEDTVI